MHSQCKMAEVRRQSTVPLMPLLIPRVKDDMNIIETVMGLVHILPYFSFQVYHYDLKLYLL